VARKPSLSTKSPVDLKRRVTKARSEGRSQQALELAKELHHQNPTPENDTLLREVYLERIRQLRREGRGCDAASLLDHVLTLQVTDPAWLESLAVELAHCGEIARSLDLADRSGNPQVLTQVLAIAADVAVSKRQPGRALLPESHQPQFDLILQAFSQLEAGQDEAMKETLQGIGLTSPFLEWKLLLRGLQAYYTNEDLRAIENWSRLKLDRLPARLAAPFRFGIDPGFRAAQPPETQMALQRQADRQQGPSLTGSLRSLQSALSAEKLPQALRLAEGIVPQFQREAPAMVPRLARIFQAAILHCGDRPDLQRYKRIFGAPPDDPDLARVEALALERLNAYLEAHKFWQKYEKSVAAHADAWPPGQADKVRALIWARMGENAARVPDLDEIEDLPPFIRGMPGRPEPLDPPAEKCFDRSLQLDPDSLPTYEDLVEHHQRYGKGKEAEAAARRLLARFPDHAETLQTLAELRTQAGDFAEALQLLQRARQVNPLDPGLRGAVSAAHLRLARQYAEASQMAQARVEFEAALAVSNQARGSTLSKWAVCEFKAGDQARAEDLIRQAAEKIPSRLTLAFILAVEAARLKLKPAIKKRFQTEFAALLEEPTDVDAGIAALHYAGALRQDKIKYTGQKPHEKQLLAYLDRVPFKEFSEQQLAQAGAALLFLGETKRVREVAKAGRKRFPTNPQFILLEADTYLFHKPKVNQLYHVHDLLDRAQRIGEKLPTDEQRKLLMEQIEMRRDMAGPRGGLGFLGNIFGPMFDPDDEYDE
jgi:tetratricopeptide (TPR) repeat protein